MRIAMVSEHASPLAAPGEPDAGGQNVHVGELAKALAAFGHEVTVWTRRDSADSAENVRMGPGVTVRHVPFGPLGPLPKDQMVPYLPDLAEALRQAWSLDPPDVVHAHFWMSGLAALAAARPLHLPVVQTFHALGHVKRRHLGDADTSPDGRVLAERAIARGADRVLATCGDELFELARLGAPRRRVAVVPCGVDTDAFLPAGPVFERGERPRLVVLGRLVRRKGVDEAIDALRRVPNAELVIAGGPAEEDLGDDPDIGRLRARASMAGVVDRVRFLGKVARIDVPALLRSADCVVCVPWFEPFGMVPLEAMACARPVVASAVGGMNDTVVDQVTGLHVPPRRPDVLAATLRKLLSSPAMRQAFGAAGRTRVVARYRWDRVAGATAEVYDQVLTMRAQQQAQPVARVGR
ncbi:glycosyltransferase [Pseudonocardia acidicola]|uniref:Glycosyltransferase family 1 protein n=1 Tax=Pseudonocardia acidicola TaxID=2724939 RepID=A0ABX1S7R7_9PSEU|nr:glycosyltransferase [Pseudonocardia acidicola]NMH96932.1 glycosyltransferase family 1 protein [Pseudonocardia acidicola]